MAFNSVPSNRHHPLCTSPTTSPTTSYDEYGTGMDVPDNVSRVTRGSSVSTGNQNRDKVSRLAREYGIVVSKPKHPNYAIKAVRLNTFKDWLPLATLSAEDMAEAGFFHPTENSDAVYCFYCGIGLKEWKAGDTPWGEHAKWSPDCVFVRNIKGPDFIEMERPKDSNSEENHVRENGERQVETDGLNRNGSSNLDTMNNPAILSLIQNGYKEAMVNQALVYHRKRHRGKSFSAKELLEIIFDIEDNNIQSDEVKTDVPVTLTDIVQQQSNDLFCRRCSFNPVSVVFLPCGHLCTCTDCAPSIKHCMLCKQLVKGTVRTYMA